MGKCAHRLEKHLTIIFLQIISWCIQVYILRYKIDSHLLISSQSRKTRNYRSLCIHMVTLAFKIKKMNAVR